MRHFMVDGMTPPVLPQHVLDKVRPLYIKGMKKNLPMLEAVSASLQQQHITPEQLAQLHFILHDLAGSGTTCGFLDVAAAGRAAEQWLFDNEHSLSHVQHVDDGALQGLLDALILACKTTIQTHAT